MQVPFEATQLKTVATECHAVVVVVVVGVDVQRIEIIGSLCLLSNRFYFPVDVHNPRDADNADGKVEPMVRKWETLFVRQVKTIARN